MATQHEKKQAEKHNLHVMIVDDEVELARSIHDYIEDESSFDVSMAHSAEEGLQMLDILSPHICIVDMRLPGMNGNEFIIKAYQKNPRIKYIIHTGSMDYILPDALRKIHITEDFVLNKPVPDMAIFFTKIKQLFKTTDMFGIID